MEGTTVIVAPPGPEQRLNFGAEDGYIVAAWLSQAGLALSGDVPSPPPVPAGERPPADAIY
jgi:hypothetical protein